MLAGELPEIDALVSVQGNKDLAILTPYAAQLARLKQEVCKYTTVVIDERDAAEVRTFSRSSIETVGRLSQHLLAEFCVQLAGFCSHLVCERFLVDGLGCFYNHHKAGCSCQGGMFAFSTV